MISSREQPCLSQYGIRSVKMTKNTDRNSDIDRSYKAGRKGNILKIIAHDLFVIDDAKNNALMKGIADRQKYGKLNREEKSVQKAEARENRRSRPVAFSRSSGSSLRASRDAVSILVLICIVYLAYCYWVFQTYPRQKGIETIFDFLICLFAVPGMFFGACLFVIFTLIYGLFLMIA